MSAKLGHFFEGNGQGENEKSFVLPKYGEAQGPGSFDEDE